MISRRIEVYLFAQICVRIEMRFATIPYVFASIDLSVIRNNYHPQTRPSIYSSKCSVYIACF